MKRVYVGIVSIVLCLSTGAFASVLDRRAGGKPTPEQSQAQVAEQQKLQGTFGEVGLVEKDTEPNLYQKGGSDNSAAGVVAEAERDMRATTNDPGAAALVADAGVEVRRGSGGAVGTFAWGILVLALGFCGVLGLRQWVVKTIPEPASPKRVKW